MRWKCTKNEVVVAGLLERLLEFVDVLHNFLLQYSSGKRIVVTLLSASVMIQICTPVVRV